MCCAVKIHIRQDRANMLVASAYKLAVAAVVVVALSHTGRQASERAPHWNALTALTLLRHASFFQS